MHWTSLGVFSRISKMRLKDYVLELPKTALVLFQRMVLQKTAVINEIAKEKAYQATTGY